MMGTSLRQLACPEIARALGISSGLLHVKAAADFGHQLLLSPTRKHWLPLLLVTGILSSLSKHIVVHLDTQEVYPVFLFSFVLVSMTFTEPNRGLGWHAT